MPTMHRIPTSFADALAVPQLAQACCADLDDGQGRTGLKELRLVNKEISVTILAQIHSFTLKLGFSDQHHSLQAVPLLRNAKLSFLNVRSMVGRGELFRHVYHHGDWQVSTQD